MVHPVVAVAAVAEAAGSYGESVDPKVPEDEIENPDDDRVESEAEQQARESEKAFDQALTRNPPG